MPRINLNADLGEGYGPWTMGDDATMLAIVNSANVACGGHAGDPDVMRRTLRLAREHGVSIGAHPSYPDLRNFGRRAMSLAPAELENQLAAQIGALMGIAAMEGIRVSHVKPHGALNNQACEDAALADVVARAVRAFDRDLILLAPALSELQSAGQRAGLAVAAEIFADRAYTDAATLVPRSRPGAVIHDADAVVAHVLRMLQAGGIVAASGKLLPTAMHSICVHGDTPGAVDNARRLRAALQAEGWQMAGLDEVIAG